jgi:hypothetical protein
MVHHTTISLPRRIAKALLTLYAQVGSETEVVVEQG